MHGETLRLRGGGHGPKVRWDKALDTGPDTCVDGWLLDHECCLVDGGDDGVMAAKSMLQAVCGRIVDFKYCNSGWDFLDGAVGPSEDGHIETGFDKLVKDGRSEEPFLSGC
jgi:hypothetical protein